MSRCMSRYEVNLAVYVVSFLSFSSYLDMHLNIDSEGRETQRKDITDTARFTSYLDMHLDIDSEGRETERKDTTYTARFTSYLFQSACHHCQCRDVCQGMK
jgi:hypothetical protein